MPQTKNADGFLHQRFCVPLTRRQALPALQRFTRSLLLYSSAGPYSRFCALHAACCFTHPQDLTRALAPYTPKGLYPSSGP